MPDYMCLFNLEIGDISDEERQWIHAMVSDPHAIPTLIEEDYYDFYLEVTGTPSLWIYSDTGDPEHVVRFLQEFLFKFRPQDHLSFEYALTCEPYRNGDHGGGAVVFTKNHALWMNTGVWIAEQRQLAHLLLGEDEEPF
jgi:hypothetical protein